MKNIKYELNRSHYLTTVVLKDKISVGFRYKVRRKFPNVSLLPVLAEVRSYYEDN